MFLKRKKEKQPRFKYKFRVKQSHILLSTQSQRNEDIELDIGEDQSDDGDDGEEGYDDAVVNNDVKEKEWTIAKEVEERPGDEDGEEDDHGDRVPKEAEEEDEEHDERVVHAVQMGLSPQPICSASIAACPPPYRRQNAVFCFYCSDFIRLMRKIFFFVVQIF